MGKGGYCSAIGFSIGLNLKARIDLNQFPAFSKRLKFNFQFLQRLIHSAR